MIDYSQSLLALSASLLQGMGCPPGHETLDLLPPEEVASYRHIVLMVFDGMGYSFLKEGLADMDMPPEAELYKISSVFPPTTAAAMTTLYTGLSPAEHGYFGWTLYMKDPGCYLNILPGTLLGKGAPAGEVLDQVYAQLPVTSIYTRIENEGDRRQGFLVQPQSIGGSRYSRMTTQSAQVIKYKRDKDFARAVYSPVKKNPDEKTFTLCYSENPDKQMHLSGTRGPWAEDYRKKLGHLFCKLASRYRDSSTLLLITSDHGMVDMEEYYAINEDPELMDLLARPPFPESRLLSFFVKEGKKDLFRERFLRKLGKDFMLVGGAEFLKKPWLGPGKLHPCYQDYVGDFVALATGRKGIKYYGTEKSQKRKPGCFKAHHAGFRPEEFSIPLIKMPFPAG